MTIVEMLRNNATRCPDRAAVICNSTQVSYGELLAQAEALASFLLEAGLQKGDRVGLLLRKTPEAIVSFLGVAMAGGIVFPIDYNHRVSDIQYIIDLTTPFSLLVDGQFLPLLSGLRGICPDDRLITVDHQSASRHPTWAQIVNCRSRSRFPGLSPEPDDPVYLNFTSGTTGTPKAALATHANIYWNTRAAIETLGLTERDIHLIMFPVFGHPHELFARPLYLGGTTVLVDTISPKGIAAAISEHGVTCMMAAASIYASLVRYQKTHSVDLSPLRLAESGGMHVNSVLADEFRAFCGLPITPVWGSTETTGIALASRPDGHSTAGSTGAPCPYYEIMLVDEQGNEAGIDEVGEMKVKGAGVCASYYHDTDETRKHMQDCWFLSGDLFTRDANGHFFFVGRKTAMMKRAGMKVYPGEIEDVLIMHHSVAEAAVVKAPDRSHGEVPRAVIVLKENKEATERDIREYCRSKLAEYKVPKIIEFVTELPKTPGGKILHRELEQGSNAGEKRGQS